VQSLLLSGKPVSKYKSAKPVVVLFCCACAIFSRDIVLAAEQRVTNVANHVIGLFGTAVLELLIAEQVENKTLQLVSLNWIRGIGYLQVLGGNGSQWPVEVIKR